MDKDKKLAWDLCCEQSWLDLYKTFDQKQIGLFNSTSKSKSYAQEITRREANIIYIKLQRGS